MEGETQITKRKDNRDFTNPLEVNLTIIGSLKYIFILHH